MSETQNAATNATANGHTAARNGNFFRSTAIAAAEIGDRRRVCRGFFLIQNTVQWISRRVYEPIVVDFTYGN